MDKKQGSDDLVKRTLDDEDDTEGQKVHQAIPDDTARSDDLVKRTLDEPGPDEAVKRG